jgi:hypothetical protein
VRAPGLWGLLGVLALLADAIYRLTPYALDLAKRPLDGIEIAALVGSRSTVTPRAIARFISSSRLA